MGPLLRHSKFFLIKSVFEENIFISQEHNVWSTLPHNEQKFCQAFNVSTYEIKYKQFQIFLKNKLEINYFQEFENVYFFFIVNQSQEFKGFGRMRAPARRNTEDPIHWKLPDKMRQEGRTFGEILKVSN